MEAAKKWYESRAVWGGIIVVAVAVLNTFGLMPEAAMQEDLIAYVTEIITALGGLLAIWGRLKADKSIE